MTDLMETAIQLMKSQQQPDQQKLEEVTTALIKLLSTQPNLAEIVPATGYLSRVFSVMGTLEAKMVKSALLIVSELSRYDI